MVRVRFLVVLVLLACLPLKVVAAVAMPFCGMPPVALAVTDEHGDHVGGHGEHANHGAMAGHSSEPAPVSDDDCNQCGLCQLACASAIPVDIPALKIRFAPVLSAAPPASFVSFIPEVLFRPPLRRSMNALA